MNQLRGKQEDGDKQGEERSKKIRNNKQKGRKRSKKTKNNTLQK